MNFYTKSAIQYNRACEKADADVKMTKAEMLANIEAKQIELGLKTSTDQTGTDEEEDNFVTRGLIATKWTYSALYAFIGAGVGALVYLYCRFRNYKGDMAWLVQFVAYLFVWLALAVGTIGAMVNIGGVKSDLSTLSDNLAVDFGDINACLVDELA